MLIVDAHVHVWDEPGHYRHPIAPTGLRSDVEHLIDLQESAGVSRAVIVQGSDDPYEYQYMRSCARRFPGRFALVGYVDPRAEDAIDYIRGCGDLGISGVRIPAAGHRDEPMLADPRGAGVWKAAAEHGIALCLYMVANQSESVRKMLDLHPETSVVIDHMGLPMEDGKPAHHLIAQITSLATFPSVYVKLSAFPVLSREPYPHRDTLRLVLQLLNAFGPNRLMWGTDFPYIQRQCGYGEGLHILTEHLPSLSLDERAQILGKTAADLFRFI